MPEVPNPAVRLAELVATMSLVSDLGMGRPMERVLRQTLLALRLADAVGIPADVRAATYYTSLLTWVGCAVETSDMPALFGDETDLYADTHGEDLGGLNLALFTARHLGNGSSGLRRAGMVGRFILTGGRSVQLLIEAHCQAASELAVQLDLGPQVSQPLMQAFERWDGRGVPGKAGATELAPAIRLVHLADNVEAFYRTGGTEAALAVARQRRGTQFDPQLVDCFLDCHQAVLDGVADIQAWDEVIALDPRLGEPLTAAQLDRALEALGDFADLKSPTRIGHSRGVASLAVSAAERLGMTREDVTLLRRAALVHDIGMIGIPSTVWEETKPWTIAQRERAQTHPYLTERMLARVPALAPVARCAALHHERLDGSGYPHGIGREALPMTARVLAVADVYRALLQPRPHRPAVPVEGAVATVRDEARDGRLDPDVVGAVLAAAGHGKRRRAALPGGLTSREAEVLVQLARGRSNPEIARSLVLSRKTVSTHLEHIYAKLGVTTRIQAALYAMREGMLSG